MREIKFRAWSKGIQEMSEPAYPFLDNSFYFPEHNESVFCNDAEVCNLDVMQYTGLKDKNGEGNICLYEGDLLNCNGQLIGNKYETPELLKDSTNILIEGLGTKNWRDAEKEALDRGWGYAV